MLQCGGIPGICGGIVPANIVSAVPSRVKPLYAEPSGIDSSIIFKPTSFSLKLFVLSFGGATNSAHVNAPGSLTRPAPIVFFAVHNMKNAPEGSVTTAIRPASITSNGGTCREPPASSTSLAVASTSATVMYICQCGGTPAAACSGCCGAIAATVSPFSVAIE